jgi:hypothetical protein
MTTHFITAEINLQEVATPLPEAIEAQLQLEGEPLRWAITAVEQGVAQVEAVVTRPS